MRLLAALACLMAGCLTPGTPNERECIRHTADGVAHLRRGSYREARDYFKLAIALCPDDPDLLYYLGRCADGLDEPKIAEGLYQQCLAKEPNHEGARHSLVAHLLANGRREEAGKMVKAWLTSQPDQPGPYVEDGLLRLADGDPDTARGRFEQALGRDFYHVPALTELGKAYEKLGREGRALVLYERAVETGNGATEARARLAALRKKGVAPPRPD